MYSLPTYIHMITGIGIHIKVKDFDKSLAFYESLGFEKVFSFGPDEEVKENYRGTIFQHGNSKLEIADGHIAVKPEVFQKEIDSSKISLMVNVENLSDIVKKAEVANIKIAVPPRHYYWGTLELVIKDPDGTVLVFIAPYSQDEAKAISADETWASPKK